MSCFPKKLFWGIFLGGGKEVVIFSMFFKADCETANSTEKYVKLLKCISLY